MKASGEVTAKAGLPRPSVPWCSALQAGSKHMPLCLKSGRIKTRLDQMMEAYGPHSPRITIKPLQAFQMFLNMFLRYKFLAHE